MSKKVSRGIALIVEDEPGIRMFSAKLLELEGFSVISAEDGEQGLALARQNQCALVLLDVKLPDHDGWWVLEQMKNAPALRDVPVIMFSASVEPHHRENALRLGAAEYMVKPVSAPEFVACIARALEYKAGDSHGS